MNDFFETIVNGFCKEVVPILSFQASYWLQEDNFENIIVFTVDVLDIHVDKTVVVMLFKGVDKTIIKRLGNRSSIWWQELYIDIANYWYYLGAAIIKKLTDFSSLSNQ